MIFIKVKKLIERLNEFDENANLVLVDYGENQHYIIRSIVEQASSMILIEIMKSETNWNKSLDFLEDPRGSIIFCRNKWKS